MNILIAKLLLISCLSFIAYQDIKDRLVYWFLFPLFGILAGYLFYIHTIPNHFAISTIQNVVISILIFSVCFIYSKYKMKTKFINGAIGIGDLLFFTGLSFALPLFSYVVLFVGSLIFSLIVHLILSRKTKTLTIPLAGYSSIFLVSVYISNWLGFFPNLYIW